jgi:hypothetical protein
VVHCRRAVGDLSLHIDSVRSRRRLPLKRQREERLF